MNFDEKGRELPSKKRIALPLGHRVPPTLQETIKRMVREAVSMNAAQQGYETFEEAEDFETGDDELPYSPHEMTEMQEEMPAAVKKPKEKKKAAPPKDDEYKAAKAFVEDYERSLANDARKVDDGAKEGK